MHVPEFQSDVEQDRWWFKEAQQNLAKQVRKRTTYSALLIVALCLGICSAFAKTDNKQILGFSVLLSAATVGPTIISFAGVRGARKHLACCEAGLAESTRREQ